MPEEDLFPVVRDERKLSDRHFPNYTMMHHHRNQAEELLGTVEHYPEDLTPLDDPDFVK